MTDQHPLTDAKCREIANNLCFRWQSHVHQDEVLYSEDDMRAAADWQLKEVLKCLNETIFERGSSFEAVNIPEELEKAMRPTTTTQETP